MSRIFSVYGFQIIPGRVAVDGKLLGLNAAVRKLDRCYRKKLLEWDRF